MQTTELNKGIPQTVKDQEDNEGVVMVTVGGEFTFKCGAMKRGPNEEILCMIHEEIQNRIKCTRCCIVCSEGVSCEHACIFTIPNANNLKIDWEN